MSTSRFTRALIRSAKVTWREQPTRYDIEALQANIERVGLVIRVRWAIVALLALFSAVSVSVYSLQFPWEELLTNMRVPALAVVFVVAYNAYYHLTYRRLGNIAFLNHAQLLFDVLVTGVLVYYSGGVASWFYALYLLFILEAAFILPRARDTWLVAAFCAITYGVVLFGELWGLLPHVVVPFTDEALRTDAVYVTVRFMWQVAMFGGAAMVATLMTVALSSREAHIAASAIIDEKTGLYERGYFMRALGSEIMRAERDDRSLYVAIVDIDGFGAFNDLFGIDMGDALLAELGSAFNESLEKCGEAMTFETNFVARFGGEEFAILLSEGCSGGPPDDDDALHVAEAVRAAAERTLVKGVGVTVSVGVAGFPRQGQTADGLLTAADEALYHAVEAGGNRVVMAA
ncbi:MAG: GGDEF domain-containing protein [Clostridiales bacterium]|nr:GGDEF domain-containing protein [Clostridiales bacterium]